MRRLFAAVVLFPLLVLSCSGDEGPPTDEWWPTRSYTVFDEPVTLQLGSYQANFDATAICQIWMTDLDVVFEDSGTAGRVCPEVPATVGAVTVHEYVRFQSMRGPLTADGSTVLSVLAGTKTGANGGQDEPIVFESASAGSLTSDGGLLDNIPSGERITLQSQHSILEFTMTYNGSSVVTIHRFEPVGNYNRSSSGP